MPFFFSQYSHSVSIQSVFTSILTELRATALLSSVSILTELSATALLSSVNILTVLPASALLLYECIYLPETLPTRREGRRQPEILPTRREGRKQPDTRPIPR